MAVSSIALAMLLGNGLLRAQELNLPPLPPARAASAAPALPIDEFRNAKKPMPSWYLPAQQPETMRIPPPAEPKPHTVNRLVFDKEPNAEPKGLRFAQFKPDQGAPDALSVQQPIPEVEVEPPGPGRIFGHLDSEVDLQQRLRQQELERDPAVRFEGFPTEPVVSMEPFVVRTWPCFRRLVEPNYVSYQRLFFEDLNEDRYGYETGLLEPFLTAGHFFANCAILPYRYWSEPCRFHETNAGYCLPGDPVPYILYPPGFSVKGAIGEAATVLSLIALFP